MGWLACLVWRQGENAPDPSPNHFSGHRKGGDTLQPWFRQAWPAWLGRGPLSERVWGLIFYNFYNFEAFFIIILYVFIIFYNYIVILKKYKKLWKIWCNYKNWLRGLAGLGWAGRPGWSGQGENAPDPPPNHFSGYRKGGDTLQSRFRQAWPAWLGGVPFLKESEAWFFIF